MTGVRFCPRSRCNGQLTVWATQTGADGATAVVWMVCDRNRAHVVEEDAGVDSRQEQLDLGAVS